MAKKPTTEQDFDNMSDEDFLKLDPDEFSGNVPDGETSLTSDEANDESAQVSNEEPDPNDAHSNDAPDDGAAPDESDGDDDSSTLQEYEDSPEGGEESGSGPDPMSGEEQDEADEASSGEQPDADAEEEGETPAEGEGKPVKGKDTPAKAGYYKLPDGMESAQVDEAIGFFQKITAPFKADGKDFSVRTPEDAIRLMQQGVNYSRRMQEIKPMKQLNRMLQDHGLDKTEQLNFLIDLSKGDKAAITQLLKSHNIDPMDLDTEKDSGYQARNYQGDPQDHEFRDALEMALTTPEGQALVSHIHKDWDQTSKARLRKDPGILGTLQNFKASGLYDQVVTELKYQQSLGYLQGIPFLDAFDQVGEAMNKAGVFKAQPNPAQAGSGSMAPLNAGQPQSQPVASGARKQTTPPKKASANPHLSSTPPSKQTGNMGKPPVDFDKMSDEEFMKIPPPE